MSDVLYHYWFAISRGAVALLSRWLGWEEDFQRWLNEPPQ